MIESSTLFRQKYIHLRLISIQMMKEYLFYYIHIIHIDGSLKEETFRHRILTRSVIIPELRIMNGTLYRWHAPIAFGTSPEGEARRYVANDFFNLTALP